MCAKRTDRVGEVSPGKTTDKIPVSVTQLTPMYMVRVYAWTVFSLLSSAVCMVCALLGLIVTRFLTDAQLAESRCAVLAAVRNTVKKGCWC